MSEESADHYIFYEVHGKTSKIRKIMQMITVARVSRYDEMLKLAKTIHKKAEPLVFKGNTLRMVGVFVDTKYTDKSPMPKHWRYQKSYGTGCYVPRKNSTAGKHAEAEMDALTVLGRPKEMGNLVMTETGSETPVKITGNRMLEWGWGVYYDANGSQVYVLRVIKTAAAEKTKPRGMKRLKYSQVVALRETTAEYEAKKKKKVKA